LATKSVSDLAASVKRHLNRKRQVSPSVKVLTQFFEVVYLASLKTEEGRPLELRIALVDPHNRDPNRPPAPRPSRWQFIEMQNRLPLTVSNLVKLAKAADPWSSCLAAYFSSDFEFFIWGMVDQTVHFNTMLVRERESGYAQPGLFNTVSTGPADLTVYREHSFVARLAQDRLLRRQNDVFGEGPISDRLSRGVESYVDAVLKPFPKEEWDDISAAYIADRWVGTLCRILISIQRYRHGGALLITTSNSHLDIKYPIDYPRLPRGLVDLGVSLLRAVRARQEIFSKYIEEGKEDVPTWWYLEESIFDAHGLDLQDEITGSVRFISSLSCVDGLILASPDLSVRGFGVEIRAKQEITTLYMASTPVPTPKSVKKIDPNHFGTRHRSMMRFCMAHPESVGFVVSQDGEIRAITRVGQRLMMWENLQVYSLHEEIPRRRLSPERFKQLQNTVGARREDPTLNIPPLGL
jgi:hypothetical protein